MGLQIVEGDASLNLIQAQTTHNMAAGQATGGRVARFLGDREKETRIRLEGAPYGRPTRHVLFVHGIPEPPLGVGIVTTALSSVEPADPDPIPAFESAGKAAFFRREGEPEWDLPRQSFGRPGASTPVARLDLFDLGSAAPGAGRRRPRITRTRHVQGQGRNISSLAEETPPCTRRLYLKQTQLVLEHMANALAGPIASLSPCRSTTGRDLAGVARLRV